MLDQLWLAIATGGVIFVAVNALFFKADDFFSKEFKEDVSLRLLCGEAKESWPEYFVQLFDRIFSKKGLPEDAPLWRKHLSWTCFWRSSVASLVAITVMSMIGVTVGVLARLQNRMNHLESVMAIDPTLFSLAFVTTLIFWNVLPDYVSLFETRYLLQRIREKPTMQRVASILLIDFFTTIAIFVGLGLTSVHILFEDVKKLVETVMSDSWSFPDSRT